MLLAVGTLVAFGYRSERRFCARDDQLLERKPGVLIALFCGAPVAGLLPGSPAGADDFSTSGLRKGCQRRQGRPRPSGSSHAEPEICAATTQLGASRESGQIDG
jgi:hypothetical protein